MNIAPQTRPLRQPQVLAQPARPSQGYARPDAREFGVGYGRSSGYASDRRYVRDWGNARFRFA